MKLLKLSDSISPDLLRKARACGDTRRVLQAMGTAVVAKAKMAFTEPGLRPSSWAPRKKEPKKPHPLLLDSLTLQDSIKTANLTGDSISIVSSTAYAAAHQLGSPKHNLPARPFLPFHSDGSLTSVGVQAVERALRAALQAGGL